VASKWIQPKNSLCADLAQNSSNFKEKPIPVIGDLERDFDDDK